MLSIIDERKESNGILLLSLNEMSNFLQEHFLLNQNLIFFSSFASIFLLYESLWI